MKLPDWLTIAASPDSSIRTALLCVASYYRNRNRRDFTRPSRSRRAVAGQVPIPSPQLHREHHRMVRLYVRDARAAIAAAAPPPAARTVEVLPDPYTLALALSRTR